MAGPEEKGVEKPQDDKEKTGLQSVLGMLGMNVGDVRDIDSVDTFFQMMFNNFGFDAGPLKDMFGVLFGQQAPDGQIQPNQVFIQHFRDAYNEVGVVDNPQVLADAVKASIREQVEQGTIEFDNEAEHLAFEARIDAIIAEGDLTAMNKGHWHQIAKEVQATAEAQGFTLHMRVEAEPAPQEDVSNAPTADGQDQTLTASNAPSPQLVTTNSQPVAPQAQALDGRPDINGNNPSLETARTVSVAGLENMGPVDFKNLPRTGIENATLISYEVNVDSYDVDGEPFAYGSVLPATLEREGMTCELMGRDGVPEVARFTHENGQVYLIDIQKENSPYDFSEAVNAVTVKNDVTTTVDPSLESMGPVNFSDLPRTDSTEVTVWTYDDSGNPMAVGTVLTSTLERDGTTCRLMGRDGMPEVACYTLENGQTYLTPIDEQDSPVNFAAVPKETMQQMMKPEPLTPIPTLQPEVRLSGPSPSMNL